MRAIRVVSLPLFLLACGETPSPTAPAESVAAPSFSSAPTMTVAPFFATALCEADVGFDIRFGGERALLSHTTTDPVGQKHETLQFRVQDFLGWKLPETVFTEATADFDVQGGAEMFAIQRNAAGDPFVLVHEGTLVFEPLAGGSSVVARHIIRQVPGQEGVSMWRCRLVA